jgi:hypothetical protein
MNYQKTLLDNSQFIYPTVSLNLVMSPEEIDEKMTGQEILFSFDVCSKAISRYLTIKGWKFKLF